MSYKKLSNEELDDRINRINYLLSVNLADIGKSCKPSEAYNTKQPEKSSTVVWEGTDALGEGLAKLKLEDKVKKMLNSEDKLTEEVSENGK